MSLMITHEVCLFLITVYRDLSIICFIVSILYSMSVFEKKLPIFAIYIYLRKWFDIIIII